MAVPIDAFAIAIHTMEYRIADQRCLMSTQLTWANVNPGDDYIREVNRAMDYWAATILPEIQDQMAAGSLIVAQRMQLVHPVRRAFLQRLVGETGSDPTAVLPPNAAMAITRRTSDSGRWAQGTLHLGGLSAEGYDPATGRWLQAWIDQGNVIGGLYASAWAAAVGETQWEPVLWSPPRAAPGSLILSAQAQETVRTMHRRTVGLGI